MTQCCTRAGRTRLPSAWEHGIEQVVRQLMSAAGLDPAAVTHLGLACQVDGVVPVGRRARRCATASSGWTAALQAQAVWPTSVGADWMFAGPGLNADASHIAPKIMWLRDHEPDDLPGDRA